MKESSFFNVFFYVACFSRFSDDLNFNFLGENLRQIYESTRKNLDTTTTATMSTTTTKSTSKIVYNLPGLAWDMSKVPKESIGKVNSCTLKNPKTQSTFKGKQFCGVEQRTNPKEVLYPDDYFDRLTADKTCKAEVNTFVISKNLNLQFYLSDQKSYERKVTTATK